MNRAAASGIELVLLALLENCRRAAGMSGSDGKGLTAHYFFTFGWDSPCRRLWALFWL